LVAIIDDLVSHRGIFKRLFASVIPGGGRSLAELVTSLVVSTKLINAGSS